MNDARFQAAFRGNKDVLYRFVYRMTGSRTVAEDIVQECFLALWRRPAAYDPRRGSLRSFLVGVARNLVLKSWRGERPHDPVGEESAVCGPIDMEGLERAEIVARAVAALPALQRETVILAEYEEMPLEEIARALDAELAAVKSRLHRARENLRRMLAPLLEGKGNVYRTRS
jgi:RNA polymerase sigma-70 factor (ECF subfamily)